MWPPWLHQAAEIGLHRMADYDHRVFWDGYIHCDSLYIKHFAFRFLMFTFFLGKFVQLLHLFFFFFSV